MATIPKLTSLIQQTEFLKCQICSKNVKDPVILSCLDTVCRGCYEDKQCGPVGSTEVKCDETAETAQQNYFMKYVSEFADCTDEEIIKSCDYCSDGNTNITATERCLQCNDNLCDTCAQAHRKTKLTRSHVIATFEQIQKGKFDKDIRTYQFISCETHSNEPLRYLCNKCDELVCRECKVSNHDKHNCTELEKACERYTTNSQTMLNKVKQKIPALENYSEFLGDYLQHIERSKVITVREIEQRASLLHQMVDAYRQSLIDKVMPAVLNEQSKVEDQQTKLNEQIDVLKHSTSYVDTLFELGNEDEILHSRHLVTDRLTELAYLQPDTMTTKLNINFREGYSLSNANEQIFGNAEALHVPLNQDNVKLISNNDSFELSTAMPMFGDSVKLVHQFECKGEDDTKDIWPSGIAMDITGNLHIVDRENRKVKVFDKDGVLIREFGHTGSGALITPYDVTVLNNGNIAVTDYDDESVKIYNHTGDYITKWKKDFKYPRGITTSATHQVLVVDSSLNRVTVHDPETGSIESEIKGKTADKCDLFNEPYYVTSNNNGYTIVTDWVAPNIKLFDPSGKYLSKYGTYGVSKGRILQPYGVCTDGFGYIFVADNHNNRIHLLGPDGKFIRFLLHEKHGLWHPMAVTINQEGHLVVTEALGNVKIFKYI